MRQQEFYSLHTAERIETAITRSLTKPFILVPDEEYKCKRFFLTQEDADTWFTARENKVMTEEIQALEFAGSTVPGEEQYKLSFNILNVDDSSTYGSTAKLRFTFATADTLNANRPTEEAVEIFFTFSSESGTKQVSKVFNYSENATEFDITKYIEPDENNITLLVRGRTSGLSLTAKSTYTAVYLPFSSSFDITAERRVGENFGIPYTISGTGTKEIEFVIDSGTPINDTVYEGSATKTYNYKNQLTTGIHTLQMKAYTTVNNKRFESDMLYFEFVVSGEGLNLTTTVIQAVFKSGTSYFMGSNPGLVGEQYVDYTLQWAYYSTSNPNAVVMWKTKLNGIETVIGSREIDEMEGTVGVMPDPVKFQPDSVGNYNLYAFIKNNEDVHIGEYTINVVENTAGLREADGYILKLDAKGRSNDEPDETKTDWSNNGYKTIFNNKMTFDGLAGYTGNAVRLDNGATAINQCKPFAEEHAILTNGCAISFYFKTRNIEDETIPLIEIGDPNAQSTAYFAIYGKSVIARPSNGKSMTYTFAAEEDTHLVLVIHPKTGVTDSLMMFLIFNGVEAPGQPYGNTAVFNIGKNSDTSSQSGMIKMGDATGKAAIDIYGIRVYNSMLSMWQGMNNYMIDKGGDVASMMRKNNLFTNNDFARPVIDTIKEQYRVLEIIGNLGMLESSNKKENFFGSCRYTDPFNPKFNFERLDGGAYIETAGLSRLEDLMAKSFHLDLNKNDAVATYQDGKLCHKNRFIFAENNIPENGVRIDLSGADSSICRNASHMKMVNKYYPYIVVDGEYVLRTPPLRYAIGGDWSRDMVSRYGGTTADYIWSHNINFAPDSVPIVVVWREKEDDPMLVYGLALMTEEKKASYANGNHSIYLKAKLDDNTFDPFDRYPGVKGDKGWDNEGVIEIEYVNPTDITNNKTTIGFSDETTRDYSFEMCFPKKKDLTEEELADTWDTFLNEFLTPITNTYNNLTAFNSKIEDILYLPSFAMYYNKVMDKKCNDSLCRNMHVIRYNMGTTTNPKWQWWAKWWDVDVCCGLFLSNAMGVDPATTRETKDQNDNYVMAGHDMWIWNALEKNETFKTWCKKLAEGSYAAGWSATSEKAMLDSITDSFSEALYNLDGLLKFLYAYRKGNDYMVRMQGSSVPYRHGFIDESYAVLEAKMAIGSYASRSASFRASGATYPSSVKITATSPWRFGIGTTTTNIVTGLEKNSEDGEFSILIPQGTTLGRDFLSVYGADKIKSLDISDFCKYLSVQINLGNLTQILKLYIGYRTHEQLQLKGFNNDTTVSFTGVSNLTRLTELSIIGMHGLEEFKMDSLNHLTKFLASGSSLKSFKPEDGTKFETVYLPDTLQTVECRNVKLGNISIWKTNYDYTQVNEYDEDGNIIKTETKYTPVSVSQMTECPTSLLTLNLVGMGEDSGTHQLVHLWCLMLKNNPTLINTALITYRAIKWNNIEKEDLFILAQIPKSQRNITGYIKCNVVYTAEERKALAEAFGDNVFNVNEISTTLVCDGNGEELAITITGNTVTSTNTTATIELGNDAQLTAAGFPIAESSADNYRWGAMVSGVNTIPCGNDANPNVIIDQYTSINRKTGKLTTTEGVQPLKVYDIRCLDTKTGASGSIMVTVKPRSYPTSANITFVGGSATTSIINNEILITLPGHYKFKAVHIPPVYTGRMALTNGGVWTIVNGDTNITSCLEDITDSTVDFCLKVDSLNGELNIKLKYESNWRNGTKLNAQQVAIAIISVIKQALGSAEGVGNSVMYQKVLAAGITPSSPNYFSSTDLKLLSGTLDLSNTLLKDFASISIENTTRYVVTSFLKNVTSLNIENCTSLTQAYLDEGLLNMTWLTSINTKGTSLNVKPTSTMTNLQLGSPTIINIDKCPYIDITNITGPSTTSPITNN